MINRYREPMIIQDWEPLIDQYWEPMINQYWDSMIIQYLEPMITQYWEYKNIPKIPRGYKNTNGHISWPKGFPEFSFSTLDVQFAGKSRDHLPRPVEPSKFLKFENKIKKGSRLPARPSRPPERRVRGAPAPREEKKGGPGGSHPRTNPTSYENGPRACQ